MSPDRHIDAALRHLRAESDRFTADLAALPPTDWERPTNCPPWTIRQMAAHLISQVERYLVSIDQAVSGVQGEPERRELRVARMNQIMSQAATKIIEDFKSGADDFEQGVRALTSEQLDVLGPHSHGPRSPRWFVEMRLAEVAVHRWDVERSLGRPADLEPSTAAFLMPMLVELNFPAVVARDKTGGQGSYRLRVKNEPLLTWRLDFAPGAVAVTRGGEPGAQATIEADPASLGLLLYGRRHLPELESEGRLTISGDREAGLNFETLFKGP